MLTRRWLVPVAVSMATLVLLLVAFALYGAATASRTRASLVVERVNDLMLSYHECPTCRRAMVMPPIYRKGFPGNVDGKTLSLLSKDEKQIAGVAKQLSVESDVLRQQIDRLLPQLAARDRAPLVAADMCLVDVEVRVACLYWVSGRGLGLQEEDALLPSRKWQVLKSRMQKHRSILIREKPSAWARKVVKVLDWYVVDRERAAREDGVALYGRRWVAGCDQTPPSLPGSVECFRQLLTRRLNRLSSMHGAKQTNSDPIVVSDEQSFEAVGLWGMYRIAKPPPDEVGAMAQGLLIMGNMLTKLEFGVLNVRWCKGSPTLKDEK